MIKSGNRRSRLYYATRFEWVTLLSTKCYINTLFLKKYSELRNDIFSQN